MNRNNFCTLTTLAFLSLAIVGCGSADEPEFDLQAVMDVTVDTLTQMDRSNSSGAGNDTDTLLVGFSDELERNYNSANPALYDGSISVSALPNAAFIAVHDKNRNFETDENEDALWMIEIDGERARIVATSRQGAVGESSISGLMTGFIIGSMLTRQRAAGVNTKSLASKRPVSASQAARSRAGSGSHARGK